jgi:cytochrome o ubiquinol oxidase subunit 3
MRAKELHGDSSLTLRMTNNFMNEQIQHSEVEDKTIFGFWVYLMTDLIIFGVLFGTYAVLRGNTFGGPTGRELFDLKGALAETLILLTSSFTCGMMMLSVYENKKNRTMFWMALTFALGIAFLSLELSEFSRFVADGNSWQRSAFLSSFFTLVGTHGLHITIGLLWLAVAMVQVWTRGLTPFITSKLIRFSFFWHFLDVVWIFIFTVVYLLPHAI